MFKEKIKVAKGIIIIIWLLLFITSFFMQNMIIEKGLFIISIIFILELAYKLICSENKRSFLKDYWYEILFLIPIMRIFRVFRIARVSKIIKTKKLFKATETILQGTDLTLKVKEAIKDK